MKLTAIVLALLAAIPTSAATISNITVTNLSSPDTSLDTPAAKGEFRTQNLDTLLSVSGDISTISNRFGWLLAGWAAGAQESPIEFGGTISYEIGFTVEDPTNEGYLVFGSTATNGWMTAKYDGGDPDGEIGAVAGGFDVEVSVDGTYLNAPLLGNAGSSTAAFSWLDSINDPHTGGGSAISGFQFGTRDFTLRVTGQPSFIYAAANTEGGSALRFGLTPLLPGLPFAATPGEDGDPADMLGHFAEINVLSFAAPAAPVPEPGVFGLMGFGLAALGLLSRRRRPGR